MSSSRVFVRSCLVILLGLVAYPGPAANAPPRPALKRAVNDQVRHAGGQISTVAVEILDLASGQRSYSYNAQRSLIPASNQKLFTTAVALDLLGPSFQHQTPVLIRGAADPGGRLFGDLAIEGGGDPNLSGRFENGDPYGAFRRWARALRRNGVRQIRGDLYLADGLFDRQFVHPDWPEDQLMWWYEAPVAALSFSDNCQLLRAWGGRSPGQPAVTELVPRLDTLRVRSWLTTTGSAKYHKWKVHRDAGSREVQVSGALLGSRPPQQAWVTVEDPVEYFAAGLRAAFVEEGIAILGETRIERSLPPGEWRTVWQESNTLPRTLDVTNKRSQNFYAESLFKLIGAVQCGQGTWADTAPIVEDLLTQRLGLEVDGMTIADGSGMSRQNRTSARQIIDLLERMYFHRYGLEFVTSLPYSGEADASLDERMHQAPYRGNVFAKTGSLNGVSSLSGYAKARSGRIYAFSILCNGGAVWRGRKAQDAIVQALIDHG